LFCKHEIENECFSSLKKAKAFLSKIVDEEERKEGDKDFYSWKLKIIKKEINVLEERRESREFIYDLTGKLLFDSINGYECNNEHTIVKNFKKGTVVKILPFPWNKYSCIDIPKYGVISSIFEDKYIIYTIDNYKIIHLHVDEKAIKKINIQDVNDKYLLCLFEHIKKGHNENIEKSIFEVCN
jgi:hypothetical protein